MKLRTKAGSASYDRTAIKRRLLVETLCDRRVLAALHGVVFDDIDQTWRQEASETALAQRLVFVDENNSGLPDDGEAYALTDSEGGFVFDELGGDEQIVRLLTRTPSQVQHFPVAADSLIENVAIDLTASDLFKTASNLQLYGDSTAVLRSGTGLIHLDLDAVNSTDIQLGSRPSDGLLLPDGRLLVLADDLQGNFAFTILEDVITPIDLLSNASGETDVLESMVGWASVAVDASGDGVLVPRSPDDSPVELRQLTVGDDITSSATAVMVAPGTTAVGGGLTTTLIAQPTDGGLALSLWSNSTATLISPEPVTIPGVASILGYSDDTGLVFAWVPGGEGESSEIKVLDADANFATLQTIGELDELVAVDTQRSVIFSLSSTSPILRAIDAVTSATLARWELLSPLSTFDDPTEIAIAPGGNELVILVAGGIATLALTTIDAHRVRTDGSTAVYPLRFAARVIGDNAVPRFQSVPRFVATQGTSLVLGEGALKQGAIDDDTDPFVVVRASTPEGGDVQITPGGALTYTPHPGFVGTDSFQVFLHDGRGASEMTSIEVDVLPPVVPNPELVITVHPVPENVVAGFNAATIQTIGMGNRPVILTIDDPRLIVVNNMVVIGQGVVLNYEETPQISATLTASDAETGLVVTATAFTVQLSDENDPITDIQSRSGTVDENSPGETIATLSVEDEDSGEEYTFEVFDDRFEIVNGTLRLKDGVSLDYEAQPEVVLNIVARDTRGGSPYSIEFIVNVVDVSEPIGPITISNASVVEYARGAVVGTVSIDGQPAEGDYELSVDDSRFEIVSGVLKLREGEFLVRADQQEAQVVITAYDPSGDLESRSETLLIEVLANTNPFHNPESPYDVNSDDEVTPLDALLILNAISQHGPAGPIANFPPPGRFWDVNGDGMITPLDALLILNYLNVQSRPRPASEPEGDSEPVVESDDLLKDEGTSGVVGPAISVHSPDETTSVPPASDAVVGPTPSNSDMTLWDGASDRSKLQLSLPDEFSSLIPQRLRDFNFRELVTDGKLDLAELRDRLIQLLTPSDWDLLERLERAIRRAPIDQSTIDAIDRALLAINAGWDAENLA
jgi:hypothetical protein